MRTIIGLSGMTESGKSTAGLYFDQHGVRRYKIIHLLDAVRALEAPDEAVGAFVDRLVRDAPDRLRQMLGDAVVERMAQDAITACSLESMGDPTTVEYLQRRFPGEFLSIYIDASLEKRLRHQMIRKNLQSIAEARAILEPKDAFKIDFWRMPEIRGIADVVIENEGTLEEFHAKLDRVLTARGV